MSLEQVTAGRLGHLTTDEEAILKTLKEELGAEGFYDPKLHDDHTLLRFLRARKFDLGASKKMWIDWQNWRKEYGADKILEEFDFPEYAPVREIYPRYYHKTDKLGRPVYIEQIGKLDVKKLFTVTTPERMIRNFVYEYEKLVRYRLPACSAKAGHHVEQSCTILDMKGVALSSLSSVYSLLRDVAHISQNYYPEMLGRMFIINAPMLFTGAWTLVKPLLDEVTVKKISILGSNYHQELSKVIEPDAIPEVYGGSDKLHGDFGPWNDGTVPGYPQPEYEKFLTKYWPEST